MTSMREEARLAAALARVVRCFVSVRGFPHGTAGAPWGVRVIALAVLVGLVGSVESLLFALAVNLHIEGISGMWSCLVRSDLRLSM